MAGIIRQADEFNEDDKAIDFVPKKNEAPKLHGLKKMTIRLTSLFLQIQYYSEKTICQKE